MPSSWSAKLQKPTLSSVCLSINFFHTFSNLGNGADVNFEEDLAANKHMESVESIYRGLKKRQSSDPGMQSKQASIEHA